MRSNFARRKDVYRSESFKRDIGSFLLLSDEAQSATADLAADLVLARGPIDRERVLDVLSKRFPGEKASFDGALDIVKYFGALYANDARKEPAASDSPDDIAADLAQVGGVYPETVVAAEKRFSEALRRIRGVVEKERDKIRRRTYAEGVLPTVSGIASTVELRGVFDRSFSSGEEVGDYDPKLLGVEPVASIRLRLAETSPEVVSFQVDEKELEVILAHLRATQVELARLKRGVAQV